MAAQNLIHVVSGVGLKSLLSVHLALVSALASVTLCGCSAVHFLIESFGLLEALFLHRIS